MVQVVSHDGGGVVKEARQLFLLAIVVGDDLVQQVDVVPAAGFDKSLSYRSALVFFPNSLAYNLLASVVLEPTSCS